MERFFDLVVHRLFCDYTAEVFNYRVVTIQERFIKQLIDRAQTPEDVVNDPLLHKFFMKLTETNEARRCLHYLFRVKCERIDTSFFTVKNLQKTYLRYQDVHRRAMGRSSASTMAEEQKSNSNESSPIDTHSSEERRGPSLATSGGGGDVKTEREQAFYKEMFI